MTPTVGLPRALLYYKYHAAWDAFFNHLGVETVTSENTSKKVLNIGLKAADSEICLPVKVFYGHALDLGEKCDYVFIPRIVQVEKGSFTCPKFLGLPDMIRAVDNPPEIISPTIDIRNGRHAIRDAALEVGKMFTDDEAKIVKAYKLAMKALRKHEKDLVKENIEKTSIEKLKNLISGDEKNKEPVLRIGIAGHAYNIDDPYISLNLIERLKERGVEVVTPENVPMKKIKKAAKDAPKDLFWNYERDVLGASYHWVKNKVVDGIIYVVAFPCGPDSTIQVFVEGYAKREGPVPLMSIVIDEHSAEAGLVTRLEAFVDLLTESKLSAQGV